MSKIRWTPVTEALPDDGVEVQVTYLGYYDKNPYCNAFAYRYEGMWYWSFDDDAVSVEITAWKDIGRPYEGDD